jgi:hypothetical protein
VAERGKKERGMAHGPRERSARVSKDRDENKSLDTYVRIKYPYKNIRSITILQGSFLQLAL